MATNVASKEIQLVTAALEGGVKEIFDDSLDSKILVTRGWGSKFSKYA